MKPYVHACLSAKRYGGTWQDYQRLHDFFDQTKGVFADMRHRAMLHSDMGCTMAVDIFGETWTNSAGVQTPTRQLCAEHQDEDVGRTVLLTEWLEACKDPAFLQMKRPLPSYQGMRDDPTAACVKRWGGEAQAYQPILDWFMQPALYSDRELALAFTHNAFGIMLAEQRFGPVIEVGAGRKTCTRDIGEALTLARWGRIPSLEQVLSGMQKTPWMLGQHVPKRLLEEADIATSVGID